MEGLNKLLLNTNDHCVLCLSSANSSKLCKADSDSPCQYTVQISNVPKICSFNSICKYLNIRLNDKGDCADEENEPDPELIGTFCNECAHILEKFSEEFLELKRIRMRLHFRLNLICDKIKEADQNGGINSVKMQKRTGKLTQTTQEEENDIDVVIVELLRRKTLESCNNKFGKDAPRVRVQNLTMKQVAKEMFKQCYPAEKVTSDITNNGTQKIRLGKLGGKYFDNCTSENLAVPILESLLVKVEESNDNPEPFYLDEFIQPFAEGDDDVGDNGTDRSPIGAGAVAWDLIKVKKEDVPTDFNMDSSKVSVNAKTSPSRSRNSARIKNSVISKKLKFRTTHTGAFLRLGPKRTTAIRKSPPKQTNSKPFIVIRSSQSPNKNELFNPVRFFNSKTNQYKCNICSKEYILRKSFWDHYHRKHLQRVKYRCLACGLEFSRADACQRHHRVIHEPVVEEKFKCLRCNKVFQRKDYLTKHEQSDCKHCPGFKYHQIEINK